MALLNASNKSKVKALAKSGNSLAKTLLSEGSLASRKNETVTNNSGQPISARSIYRQVASGSIPLSGGKTYTTSARSQQLASSSLAMLDAGTDVGTTDTGSTYTRSSTDQPGGGDTGGAGVESLIQPEFNIAGAADLSSFWKTITDPNTTQGSLGYANKFPGDTNAQSTPSTIGSKETTPRPTTYWSSPSGAGGGTTLASGGGTPTNKDQANKAGVQDTGGASASGGNLTTPETDSQLKLAYSLLAKYSLAETNDITSTSDPFEVAHSNMDSVLSQAYKDALADLPDYEKMKSDAEDLFDLKKNLIDERRDQLEDRYKEDRKAIEEDYATQEVEKKEAQARETGKLAGGLAAAGAYLGFDNINHSAMLSLQVTHQRELTVLGQAKVAAISTARRAFEDADYALLGEQINAIDAYNKQITDLTKDHFNQTLQLAQEARANVKFMQDTEAFERSKSFDNLDAIVKSGKMPSATDLQKYAAQLNLSPEEVRGYIQAGIDSAALEKKKDKTALDIQRLSLLKSIDKGTYVTIDGVRYEGLNTPTSSSTSSSRVVSNSDVADKFGSSPYAYSKVDGETTYGQLVETFSQQNPPADWLQMWEEDNLDMLMEDGYVPGDKTTFPIYWAQMQNSWNLEKKNFWGEQTGTNLGDFDDKEINVILGELAETEGRSVYIDEIRNDYTNYPPAKLQQILNDAYTRRKEGEGGNPEDEEGF
jgi:hypothetical protein